MIEKKSESFITEKPKSTLLKKYISYYYFHNKAEGDKVQFMFYPHLKSAITVYKNSNTESANFKSQTYPDSSIDYKFLYQGIQLQACSSTITPPFSKIGIAFQPLGLNYFVNEPLANLLNIDETIEFNYFKPSIVELMDQVYACQSIEKKIKLLDAYFKSKLSNFKEERLEKAIQLIIKSDKKFNVEALANELSINRKTLLRLFRKHLNCSTKDYLHICQFRKAVDSYKLSGKKKYLGELAHMHDYYDQSDFIKHFKKITGFNPKRFFKDIKHMGNEDIFWSFVN